MSLGLIGRKIGMTRIFDAEGVVRPVTVVEAGPCPVLVQRTQDVDGYTAVQLGFAAVRPERLSKPMRGVFQVLGVDAFKYLMEFRLEDGAELPPVGEVLTVSMFAAGDLVNVRGRSKGRGFAGVLKRHNFGGGRDTHGSKFHRAPGSIGTNTTPGRTLKGRKLPGQFGNKMHTIRKLKIVDVVADDNLLLIGGAVPGARGTILKISKA